MRTTIRLDEQLLTEAKEIAARSGKTLTSVIEEALRESIARRRQTPRSKKLRLHTVGGSGLQPGIDLDDSASLLEMMEQRDDAV